MKDEDFKFEAEVGTRLHRYFMWVQCNTLNIWWNCDKGLWEEKCDTPHRYSNSAPCKTFKAYKRMIRKNPVLLGNSVLVNRYANFDIYSIGELNEKS